MRRLALLPALLIAVLTWCGSALGARETLTFTTQAISVPGYGVATAPMLARSPAVDGYVVAMDAEVVDSAGNVQGDDDIMLHHVVFAKIGTPDYTCAGALERFYAIGEERVRFALPPGYGYANRGSDAWGLLYMLMNHRKEKLTGYIRYRVEYVTGETLTPVRPVWLDVRNCKGLDPSFDVPGTGGRGSTFTEATRLTMRESGRFVAGGGHLHGGGIRLELRNRSCGTTPFTSLPTWGGPEPKPLLHEPGPVKMSQFASPRGVPVSAGETLELAAVYDDARPHTRAMGIMLLYFAPGVTAPCEFGPPLALELGNPGPPPPFSMPLPRKPRGPLYRNLRSTWVGDYRYGHERIVIRRGTTFTWRFVGAVEHDVTLVSGPVGFSSPWTRRGTFRHKFVRPGTYKLFCSLHPAHMTQEIVVRR